MNWEVAGAMGEVIAAVAVCVSLVYLALQMRESSKAVRTQTEREMLTTLNDVTHQPWDDPDLVLRGLKTFELLSDEEKVAFGAQLARMVKQRQVGSSRRPE